MEEKKLLTVEFFDKRCTTVAVPHLCEDLLKIDGDILKCNEKIEAAGLAGVSYTSKSSQICEGCDQLGNMNAYVDSAHAQVSDGLDWPLWLNFKSGATETISRIKAEDISTENNIGLEEHVEFTGHGVRVYDKQVKSKLTFEDFVELDPVKGKVGRELTEVGGMKTFRSLFHLEYVKVKEQMPDVDNPREYMKELLVWGQEDHKGYHPVKDFISGLADLIFIIPLIEMCIGYDFITEEDLSEQDMTMKGVSVVTGVISLGLALKTVNLLSKTGLQVGAKAVALDLTSSAVGYAVGDLSNRLGLPLPITLILSGGATAGTFKVASKHVFSDADSIVKVLSGGSKVEKNLKFSLEGSSNLDDLAYQRYWNDVASGGHLPPGMTAEEYTKYIKGLNKLDDINALNRVDYDEALKLRKGSSNPPKVTDEEFVTYRRVQGGTGNAASQERILLDESGNVYISNKNKQLNISIDDGTHSNYFQNNNRPGSDIIEFDVPKWFDDFVQETAIPQAGYKNNPLNQGGTVPKITDPTTPGVSIEFPAPWIEWIEEYARNGRIIKGGG